MPLWPKWKKIKKKLSDSDEFWCELALALGGTVGELQSRMGVDEYELWLKYRHKYGPLNPVRKYDEGLAIVASQINRAFGGKATPLDFMPYGKEEQVIDLNEDEFISKLGKGAKIGKRR